MTGTVAEVVAPVVSPASINTVVTVRLKTVYLLVDLIEPVVAVAPVADLFGETVAAVAVGPELPVA